MNHNRNIITESSLGFYDRNAFTNGLRDGIPIALGYLAVAFSLGIVARKAGLTPFQGFLSSILNHASAGEYAEFTVISAGAPYLEMAFVILITNMRYLLMSCALSQKFDSAARCGHRLLVGFGITDEIFGISIGKPGTLNPFYTYGAMTIALPSWAFGTAMGVVAGNVLPVSLVSALSVALYGMFIAIIIPAAKASRVVGGVVAASFLASFIMSRIPLFDRLSDSMKISLLTVLIAGAAALLFPIKEKDGAGDRTDERQEGEVKGHDA
ncbi:AzlC family ABC transporter permease [Acetatifactor aquisgranensis]|uniref:AzlC family ABC transporter permease n=1 Tax=Acetatifactor aquisgranensis TaxID=2941233 RepID=UPI002042673A|nr:AzlC family ABC transporter permease [Acetatifactor aquisgranensis]